MSANRARVWFALFVLTVFCVGAAVGVVFGRRMSQPPPFPGGGFIGGRVPAGPRGGRPGMLVERLGRELQLTDDQRIRVQAIFEARRPRLETIQREMAARAGDEQRELQAEVRKVLTPEQQGRFDRWLEQQPRGRRGRGPLRNEP